MKKKSKMKRKKISNFQTFIICPKTKLEIFTSSDVGGLTINLANEPLFVGSTNRPGFIVRHLSTS